MSSRWVNVAMSAVLVGIGLAAGGDERASDLALGVSLFVLAFLAMALPRVRRVNTLLGAWAAISPFALAYRDPVRGWIDVAAGVVVVVASLWPDRPSPRRWEAARQPAA
jgi:hypothetical protein